MAAWYYKVTSPVLSVPFTSNVTALTAQMFRNLIPKKIGQSRVTDRWSEGKGGKNTEREKEDGNGRKININLRKKFKTFQKYRTQLVIQSLQANQVLP